MVRTVWRMRLLWQALACATFAFALAGCGGGGGGGSSTPPANGGGGAPTESAWLLAEFVAADSNHQAVRVWDPAHPSVAIQSVRLVQGNGIVWSSSHLVFSDATTYDAPTHSVTTLGHAKVFFDNDGTLYSIDLRGGRSHVPVPLSSAADVFLPVGATPMNAAGDDAWIDVQGGSHHWAIRATMSATDAPVAVLKIVAPLRDAGTGLPQYFFASLGGQSGSHVTPTTYEIVDASFAPVSVAEVTAMAGTDGWVGADPARSGLGYLRIANQLHALHWSAGAVSVDPADLYDFSGFGAAPSVADAQSLYFNDGGALLAVGDGSVHAVGSFSALPAGLLDAGDYVAATEITAASSTQTFAQLETVRKSDGHLTLVEGAAPGLRLLGATDQALVVASTLGQGQAFVLARGDNATRTTLGSQYVGVVRAPSARVDQLAPPVALLSCVAGIPSGFCAPGALTQLDLSGGSTTLGLLAATAPWLRGDATAGLAASLAGQTFLPSPAGLGSNETDVRDAWQFMPASASSLARITNNLP